MRRPLAVLALVVALGGCAKPEHPPPRAGDDPILVIQHYPGLGPPTARYALPDFVLLADGTAIVATAGRGNALTAERRLLSPTEVADLYRRAHDAGLMRSKDYRQDDVLDASALVVRITTDREAHRTTVIQPSLDDWGARGRVVRFAAEATASGMPAGPYVPERVAAIAQDIGGGLPRCQVVDRARAPSLLKGRWLVRPLLPYERDCADL